MKTADERRKQELIDLGMQLYLEDIRLKQEIQEYKRKNKLWFFKSYYHWLKNERIFHSIAFLKVDMELMERFGCSLLEVEAKQKSEGDK